LGGSLSDLYFVPQSLQCSSRLPGFRNPLLPGCNHTFSRVFVHKSPVWLFAGTCLGSCRVNHPFCCDGQVVDIFALWTTRGLSYQVCPRRSVMCLLLGTAPVPWLAIQNHRMVVFLHFSPLPLAIALASPRLVFFAFSLQPSGGPAGTNCVPPPLVRFTRLGRPPFLF